MIYLAEDDDATRDAICLLLDCEAIPVRAFASCDALCRAVDPRAAECLILNIQMPGESGLELLERLRGQGTIPPVVLMTGRLNADICRRSASAGARAVLEKPFKGDELVVAVKSALDGRNAPGDPS